MTNHYENCREAVLIDISKGLENADILTLYDIRRLLTEAQPLFIRDYIDKHWDNHSEGFRDDLEYELRKLWLEMTKNCRKNKFETNGYLNSVHDMTYNRIPLDIWIMEQGTEFNPADLAQAIYHIYIGKVVFNK